MTPEITTEQRIAVYAAINQYGRDNGMELSIPEPGKAVYTMTVKNKHLSSPGTAHGGIVAGLMDATIGAAALFLAMPRGEFVSTVEFKMNYFAPVKLGDQLRAEAEVEHSGKRLIVSRGTIYRGDEAVASGMGTFNAYPMAKKDLDQLRAMAQMVG